MTLLDPISSASAHAAPHRHGPSGAMAQAQPAPFSVLRSSLAGRLAVVAGLSAVMWALVLWVVA
ncbi:hypothetical protein [Roseixanthobacter liquoris]|uniref:hypothetical protein n=1 Tax=Roseixanthobacter liquoris TaxID=3119921 RepID=UPI00372CE415